LAQISYNKVLEFWFSKTSQKLWFNSTPAFDETIRLKYLTLWEQASDGYLEEWQHSPLSSLALIIILDQFPLNMFRGEAKSYSTEKQAVHIVHSSISKGYDKEISITQLQFFYMPLMHSENLDDQNYAVHLFEQAYLENNIKYAKHHRDIICKFGRFPHRNKVLGRESTMEEQAYLASPQAFTG